MDSLALRDGIAENEAHFWGNDPSSLVTEAELAPGDFFVDSGLGLYNSTILPALESAQHEILFVTCFLAHSECLDRLSSTLVKLSERISTRSNDLPLRVRLCFSSSSITQKLFHTSSPAGYIYPPSKWTSLGLPSPELLQGIDLRVKSIFVRPFSVMHPKFVILDRQRALIPSCNLSWESWLECCLPVRGLFVDQLLRFWQEVWGHNNFLDPSVSSASSDLAPSTTTASMAMLSSSLTSIKPTLPYTVAQTAILLPSPYHRNPRFRPFTSFAAPPRTPLNTMLFQLISAAKKSIMILTPNLTCHPVISALLAALSRGVNVTIVTNRRMMVLEQLVTAGTITEICIWRLKARYNRLLNARTRVSMEAIMEEAAETVEIGSLDVGYFFPGAKHKRTHIKCTIIDDQVVVLGSGNMDRASWYTSQELGIAIESADVVREVWRKIEREGFNGGFKTGVEWL